MQEFTILRDGAPALLIEATQKAQIESRGSTGDAQHRWHEVVVYELAAGGWVASVGYRSTWQAETDGHNSAFEAGVLADLIVELQGVNATEHLLGRPERSEAEEKHNKPHNQILRDGLRRRWDRLISDLCKMLGVVEVR